MKQNGPSLSQKRGKHEPNILSDLEISEHDFDLKSANERIGRIEKIAEIED